MIAIAIITMIVITVVSIDRVETAWRPTRCSAARAETVVLLCIDCRASVASERLLVHEESWSVAASGQSQTGRII